MIETRPIVTDRTRDDRPRATALIVVLAVLVLVTTALTVAVRQSGIAAGARRAAVQRAALDDLAAEARRIAEQWLEEAAADVVLPSDVVEPSVAVLHDAWSVDGRPWSIRVTAYDQCGMVPLTAVGARGALADALPSTLPTDVVPRRTAEQRRAIFGADQFVVPVRRATVVGQPTVWRFPDPTLVPPREARADRVGGRAIDGDVPLADGEMDDARSGGELGGMQRSGRLDADPTTDPTRFRERGAQVNDPSMQDWRAAGRSSAMSPDGRGASGRDAAPDADTPVPLAVAALIATHHAPRPSINVATAPAPLVAAACRVLGMDAWDTIAQDRDRGAMPTVPGTGRPAAGSAERDRSAGRDRGRGSSRRGRAAIELVTTSDAWAFRVDVEGGLVRRSWWMVYQRSTSRRGGASWQMVQQVPIHE